jgi:hypothetical protein
MAESRSVPGRGPRRFAWILFAVVIAAIIWVIVEGVGNTHRVTANEPKQTVNQPQVQPAPGRNSQPSEARANDSSPITDLSALLNGNQEQMVGRTAELKNVKVLHDVGRSAFWIGTGGSTKLLVIPQENNAADYSNAGEKNEHPSGNEGAVSSRQTHTEQPGQTLNITGKIEKLPNEHDAMKRWNLSSSEAAMLGDQHVYLAATQVQPAQGSGK